MDDLLKALNSGQLNLDQGNFIGQDVCGTLDAIPDIYESQQNLINTEVSPLSNQPISYPNFPSQPSFQVDQGGYGYQQPSVSFPSQPSLPICSQTREYPPNQPSRCNAQQPSISFPNQPNLIASQSCNSQPSISLNKPYGFNVQQPSITFSNEPIFTGSQISESQPSVSLPQPFRCGIQQPTIPLLSQPNLSIGSQNGCQPSISLNQQRGCNVQLPSINYRSQNPQYQPIALDQQYECNSSPSTSRSIQPSISLGSSSSQQSGCGQPSLLSNLRGYQPSLLQNQQPATFSPQPTISLPSQSCNLQSFSTNKPTSGLRESNNQQTLSVQPAVSFNSLSSQSCQRSQPQASPSQCNSQTRPQISNVGSDVAKVSNNVASVVPNALLQAPPFGIVFDGDNLIIEGAVQICGTMPFNSAVRVSGVLPASGVGNVQYVCEDIC